MVAGDRGSFALPHAWNWARPPGGTAPSCARGGRVPAAGLEPASLGSEPSTSAIASRRREMSLGGWIRTSTSALPKRVLSRLSYTQRTCRGARGGSGRGGIRFWSRNRLREAALVRARVCASRLAFMVMRATLAPAKPDGACSRLSQNAASTVTLRHGRLPRVVLLARK